MNVNGNRDQEIYDKSYNNYNGNGRGNRNKDLYPVVFEALRRGNMIDEQAKVIAEAIQGLGDRMDQHSADTNKQFAEVDKQFVNLENSMNQQFTELRVSIRYINIFMGAIVATVAAGAMAGFITLLMNWLA